MFKYILLCTLLAHTIWAKPVHQHAELAPHVLIVTPQAQLRLESLIPGAPIIQHLSPFTRFIAPHEETIVYVPTSAAAAIQPLQYAEVVARSLPSSVARQDYNQIASNAQEALTSGASQLQEAVTSGFQGAGTLIAGSTSSFAPGGIDYSPVVQGLASAASAASAAAQSAGSSLAGAASFAPGGIDYSPVVQGLASAANAASAAAQSAGSSLAASTSSFAPGDIDYSPLVQGLASAASAASAAAQSAGSSLAGAASFAPGDPSGVVQGFLEQGPSALSSAATAASAAAASAGNSFVSGFTQAGSLSASPTSGSQQQPTSLSSSPSAPLEPSPLPAPSLSSPADNLPLPSNKLPIIEKIEYEIPITPILANEPRHHYVIAPAVPHIVDFVQGPILLAPSISTIKARSLQELNDKEKPLITIPLPEIPKPEALPLANDLDKGELLKDIDDKEKKSEFKRFLEANALKEDQKPEALKLKEQIKPVEEQKVDKINLEKAELELKSVPIVDEDDEEDKPQSKVA